MTDLSLFENEKEVDLSLFEAADSKEETSEIKRSEANVSAQAALISNSEDKLALYQELNSLPKEVRRDSVKGIKSEQLSGSEESLVNSFTNMVVEGELDEGQSLAAASALPQEMVKEKDSLQVMAEKFNTTPSINETKLESDHVLSLSSMVTRTAELQKEKQKLFNMLSINKDGDRVSLENNYGDLAEALVPFVEQKLVTQFRLAIQEGDSSALEELFYFVLSGEGKSDLQDTWANATYEQQLALIKAIPKALEASSGIVFTNDNELLKYDLVMSMMNEEYYGTFDRALDDVVSALDSVGLGWMLGGVTKSVKASKLAKLSRRSFRGSKQPVSPRAVAEQVNPEQARQLHTAEMADATGEVAQAVSGTSRTEAAVDAVAPQVRTEDNAVEAVPYAMDRDILAAVTEEVGNIQRSASEIEMTAQKLSQELSEISGLTANTALSTAPEALETGKIRINQVYTRGSVGFSNPVNAINETLLKLRNYGVQEENITLLRKNADGEYVETSVREAEAMNMARETLVAKKKKLPEELKKTNLRDDYAVRVNLDYEPSAMQMVREDLSVSSNVFERSTFQPDDAGISRWFLPPQAIIDSKWTGGGSVAVDRSNRLQKLLSEKAEPLLKKVESLNKGERAKVEQVLFDQALQKRYFSRGELVEEGLSQKAIQVIEDWKVQNDQYWHLANLDLARHYKSKGFSIYIDKSSDSSYIVRPLNINMAKSVGKAFDPVKNKVVSFSKEELEEIYSSGGAISKFRSPEKINGIAVDHVVSYGSDAERYVRGISESDRILAYRPGHSFTIRYRDPYFIEMYTVDKAGNEVAGSSKAVMTAENKKSALAAVERFASRLEDGAEIRYRAVDNKDLNPEEAINKRFDVLEASGLTAQKKRGETLPTYRSTDADTQYNIQSPLESMKVTIRELANRIPMRQYLDDLETTWIEKYGDLAATEKNSFGRPTMPRDASQITKPGIDQTKRYADAKSTLEFYNMMKYGYHNSLDRFWRRSLNWLADEVGTISSRFEGAVRAVGEEVPSPTGFFRALAFNHYIAASMPTSQWLVQGVPALANSFLHPKYVFSGKMAADLNLLTLGILSKKAPKTMKKVLPEAQHARMAELLRDWEKSGLGAGIDKHLIVENGLDSLIESTRMSGLKAAYNTPFDKLRQVGFDTGEFLNLSSYFLGTRNDFVQKGMDLTSPRVMDQLTAKVRNLTLNMNKAGEMPWNKNSLSLITQFLISPYKGMTVFLNKGLTAEERTALATWNLIMMPMPAMFSYELRSNFDLEPEVAEIFTNGVFGGMINIGAKAMYGNNTSISFERLNQFGPDMPYELVYGLLTEPVASVLASSPSLSMITGHNPVLARLVDSTYKLIKSPFDGATDQEIAERMDAMSSSLFNSTALGRSLSTAYKELWLQEYDRRYSGLGFVARESLTPPLSYAKAFFGLGSTLESVMRRAGTVNYYESEDMRKDVLSYVSELNRLAADSGFNIDDPGREEFIMRHFMAAFPEGTLPPQALKMFRSALSSSFKKGEAPIANQVFKAAGWLGTDAAYEMANALKDLDPKAAEVFEWARSEKAVKEMGEFLDE